MSIRARHRLRYENLEPRYCLAMSFATHRIGDEGCRALATADLDGDGDDDILERYARQIGWCENVGNGQFQRAGLIIDGDYSLVQMKDLNGDGDLDVLATSGVRDDNGFFSLVWHENMDGKVEFGSAQRISEINNHPSWFSAVDVDFDGDNDIFLSVFGNAEKEPLWFENIDGTGSFERNPSFQNAYRLAEGDLEGDGDLDILIRNTRGEFSWLENLERGGAIRRVEEQQFSSTSGTGDFDGDGDTDYYEIAGVDVGVRILHNSNGVFDTTTSSTFELDDGISSLTPEDVDGDGDLDFVFTIENSTLSVGELFWAENSDGRGSFRLRERIDTFVHRRQWHELYDRDGDGDLDIRFVTDAQSVWHIFDQLRGRFDPQVVVTAVFAGSIYDSALADLDGDGDLDLIESTVISDCASSASYVCFRRLSWFENLDGQGSFGLRKFVDTDSRHDESSFGDRVFAIDFDNDGDHDLLRIAAPHETRWVENIDGLGTFSQPQDPNVQLPEDSLLVQDFDGDGDFDFIGSIGQLAWQENLDGRGRLSDRVVLPIDAEHLIDFDADDVDADGDIDFLVYSSDESGELTWYENQNPLFVPHEIHSGLAPNSLAPSHVEFVDVDGDTRKDALLHYAAAQAKLIWFVNSDGKGSFEKHQELDTLWTQEMQFSDLDFDGDTDIVFPTANAGIVWHENIHGEFADLDNLVGDPRLDFLPWGEFSIGDIDGDNDMDLIAFNRWYENRPIGDVNSDGRFDSRDLVIVFQAGEYEDRANRNSSFEEGDWNADGDFDSNDLVLAFQSATYTPLAKIKNHGCLESNRPDFVRLADSVLASASAFGRQLTP